MPRGGGVDGVPATHSGPDPSIERDRLARVEAERKANAIAALDLHQLAKQHREGGVLYSPYHELRVEDLRDALIAGYEHTFGVSILRRACEWSPSSPFDDDATPEFPVGTHTKPGSPAVTMMCSLAEPACSEPYARADGRW